MAVGQVRGSLLRLLSRQVAFQEHLQLTSLGSGFIKVCCNTQSWQDFLCWPWSGVSGSLECKHKPPAARGLQVEVEYDALPLSHLNSELQELLDTQSLESVSACLTRGRWVSHLA